MGLALGLAACQQGFRVRFTTAAALVHELIEARDEKRLLRYQKYLSRRELLIVDELGFVPLSKTGAGGRGKSISTRHCRSSSEQLRRLFSLARSTCGAVQNILSLLFLVLRSVSCRRYLPCHGSALPTAPQAHGDVRLVRRAFQYTVACGTGSSGGISFLAVRAVDARVQ
jgi:hypothetical protein